MAILSSEDRSQLLKLLIPLPILANERGRDSVLINADLQELRPQLDLDGASIVVIPIMIEAFCKYGRLTYEHEALGRFLNTMKGYVGLDSQGLLDNIIRKYSLMTPTKSTTQAIEWLTTITSKEVFEKIIGENTLRPIAFLQRGLDVSRSVAYIEVVTDSERWSGTGFMISPSLFLTNHHVLPNQHLLPGAIFRFNYQLDINGNAGIFKDYVAAREGIYQANEGLDYSVVELHDKPGNEWGYLHLRPQIPVTESRVNIIQHPNGLPKQISIQNNFIKFANVAKIQYVTSTLPGSSGSPVFDNDWKVIGLHHAGGMLPEEQESPLYFRNEGITIKAIVGDLPEMIKAHLTLV